MLKIYKKEINKQNKKEKNKISKTIKKSYLSTKNLSKSKHCWYKMS